MNTFTKVVSWIGVVYGLFWVMLMTTFLVLDAGTNKSTQVIGIIAGAACFGFGLHNLLKQKDMDNGSSN